MSASANLRCRPLAMGWLRKILAVSLVLHALIYVLSTAVDSMNVYLMHCELNEVEVDEAIVSLYGLGYAVSALGSVLTLLFSQIVFLVFVYRLNRNARCLRGVNPTLSPGWVVGVYLVPVVNFVLPYVNLQELSKIGRCATPQWRSQPNSMLVGAFWVTVIGSRLLVIGSVYLSRLDTFEVTLQAGYMDVAVNLVVILNCYLAWRVLTQIDHQLNMQISLRQAVDQWSCLQCSEKVSVAEKVCPMCGTAYGAEVVVGAES